MRKKLYGLAFIGVVLSIWGAENFVLSKKAASKKKPRMTQEHLVACQGECLQDLTQVFKHGALVQEKVVAHAAQIMNQEKINPFKDFSQEKFYQYNECMRSIQQASKEYAHALKENCAKLEKLFL